MIYRADIVREWEGAVRRGGIRERGPRGRIPSAAIVIIYSLRYRALLGLFLIHP